LTSTVSHYFLNSSLFEVLTLKTYLWMMTCQVVQLMGFSHRTTVIHLLRMLDS